jgi:acetyl-CoA acetyltransferase
MVSVVQREWEAKNPRATFKAPITVDDVLNSRMIAYPFRLLQCCLVTDGGGALILVAAERARDFPPKPVYLLGTGESVETPMVSPNRHSCESRNPGPQWFWQSPWTPAFAGATKKTPPRARPRRRRQGLRRSRHHAQQRRPSDDLKRPLFGARGKLCAPADLRARRFGLCAARRGRRLHRRAQHRARGKLPLNTNGGGLSYMHSGMYGMYALQESVRQMRGIAPAQIPSAKISVCHGVGLASLFRMRRGFSTDRPWSGPMIASTTARCAYTPSAS